MILAWPWFSSPSPCRCWCASACLPEGAQGETSSFTEVFPAPAPGGQPLWRMMPAGAPWYWPCAAPSGRSPDHSLPEQPDLILAVDLSDSMRTQDMLDDGEQTDRLAAVRQQISNLVASRPGIESPWSSLPITPICSPPHPGRPGPCSPWPGSSISIWWGAPRPWGEAILLARQHADPTRPTALLLVTDGRNTSGNADPLTEARLAAKAGIRLSYPGVGADPDTFAAPAGDADPVPNWMKPCCSSWRHWERPLFRARNRAIPRHQPGHRHPGAPRPAPDPLPAPPGLYPGHWPWPGCCSAGQPAGTSPVTGHPMSRLVATVAPWS